MVCGMISYVLLIVADEPLQLSLTQLLESEGYALHVETDTLEGANQIARETPGVIVITEGIPDVEGEDALHMIRRITRTPIIVVGSGGETAVVRALLDGADVYLRRPVNQREFLSRIRALMRRLTTE